MTSAPLVFHASGNISMSGREAQNLTGSAMSRLLLILLLPIALAGCAVGHLSLPMTPMTLGPSDDTKSKSSCLTYKDAPAFGDCQGAGTVSIPADSK
jgi:hypothetical protein